MIRGMVACHSKAHTAVLTLSQLSMPDVHLSLDSAQFRPGVVLGCT